MEDAEVESKGGRNGENFRTRGTVMEVPASVFHNMIILCFSKGEVGGRGLGAPRGCQTQSALREGLLDLIQHIPKQRRLVTFSVDGNCLISL